MKGLRLILLYCVACQFSVAKGQDIFGRKPGMGEIDVSTSFPNCPVQAVKTLMCLDEHIAETVLLGQKCEKPAWSGDRLQLVCPLEGSRVTSRSTLIWNGDAAYHNDITLHADPPLR